MCASPSPHPPPPFNPQVPSIDGCTRAQVSSSGFIVAAIEDDPHASVLTYVAQLGPAALVLAMTDLAGQSMIAVERYKGLEAFAATIEPPPSQDEGDQDGDNEDDGGTDGDADGDGGGDGDGGDGGGVVVDPKGAGGRRVSPGEGGEGGGDSDSDGDMDLFSLDEKKGKKGNKGKGGKGMRKRRSVPRGPKGKKECVIS
jgi:hypothetical protein